MQVLHLSAAIAPQSRQFFAGPLLETFSKEKDEGASEILNSMRRSNFL
jgi:hypothetical protein